MVPTKHKWRSWNRAPSGVSAFTLALQMHYLDQMTRLENEGPLSALPGLAPRILIIDDEPVVQHLFGMILSKDHYSITKVTTGRSALRAVSETQFDLIILDMSLPDYDGPTLMGLLQAKCPFTKILATSGDMSGVFEQYIARVAGATLAKPATPRAL